MQLSQLIIHTLTGINRHFHMACIHDKFTTSTGKRNISSEQLWQHLKELYNLPALVSNGSSKTQVSAVLCHNNMIIDIFKLGAHESVEVRA